MNSKEAKQIPIEVYLDRLGYKPKIVKKNEIWYLSPLRVERTASFKVNKILNTWYDYGEGAGGTIIDLVIHQFQTDVSGALSKLESAFGGIKIIAPALKPAKKYIEKMDNREITEIKALSSFSLIDYLTERKVNIKIAERYLFEIHYKKDGRLYFSLCFKNNSGGYELRDRNFKGSFPPKDITTIKGVDGNRKILLFEGFIDFLSYLTYFKKISLDSNVIVLNSVSLDGKAIEEIKNLNPTELHFYFDNDTAGEKAKEVILKETGIYGFHKNLYYAGYKDVNDFIRGIKQK